MLTLPIKKQWFKMLLSGEKQVEYREIKPYYQQRLERYVGKDVVVKFRNGYSPQSPYFVAKVRISIGTGNPNWGARQGELYYCLHLLEICEVSND